MDERLQRLLDRDEIRSVLHRYCRGIDRLDLDTVRGCYHADAVDDHGSFRGDVDAYLEWVAALLARYTFTMHFLSNVEVSFPEAKRPTAGGPARFGVAAVESYGLALHRGPEAKAHLNLATGFRFLDRFERRDDTWRIAHRQAVTEWSMAIPSGAWWRVPDALAQGRRDGNDALYGLLASLSEAGTTAS